ncbi:phosphodiester glycosidase family protein [Collimonas sp. NPDC087041]|uniref:phosphodiester glycosidase family protein n=1 Tax=Collimonas sp. NPDC087041 TaxID=3363960 RepID=UPI00380EC1B7
MQEFPYRDGVIHVCRINLLEDSIRMFWKDDQGKVFGNFYQLNAWLSLRKETLACATNGGIYQVDLTPLGLYVEEGRILRRLNQRKNAFGNFYVEPRGIFLIQGQQARIVDVDTFENDASMLSPSIRFATQSGPMLLQHGSINPQFPPQSDNQLIRNAVCTSSAHDVMLVMSSTPVSFYEFSNFLRDKLGCSDALHLDSKVSRLYPTANTLFAPPLGVIIGVTRPIN